jgi:hypothetical protein
MRSVRIKLDNATWSTTAGEACSAIILVNCDSHVVSDIHYRDIDNVVHFPSDMHSTMEVACLKLTNESNVSSHY